MKRNGVTFLKLERDEFRITLGMRNAPTPEPDLTTATPQDLISSSIRPESMLSVNTSKDQIASPGEELVKTVISPMVGTFYTAPSPQATPFAKVGTVVVPDTIVCLIEAMKVMNEIRAELSGTILEVLAENGASVQFGQPLFRLK